MDKLKIIILFFLKTLNIMFISLKLNLLKTNKYISFQLFIYLLFLFLFLLLFQKYLIILLLYQSYDI